MANRGMFVANTSGSAEVNGVSYTFHEGITRFAGDSPVVTACPLFFDPVDPAPVVEQATAAPGEKRGEVRGDK
jgi:hypothetical protein